jgi:protein-tyrosine-phosphatase
MSNEHDKLKHSRRIHKDQAAIDRQVEIARAHGITITEPHKYAKSHVLNCGDPKCILCMNPRKYGEKPIQELRQNQDVDTPRDRHSNGSTGTDDE